MRFLLSAAVAALAVTGVSGACSVKSNSVGSTACTTVTSSQTELFNNNQIVTVFIPTFDDTTGAILDAVYITAVDTVYVPFGTYTAPGGGSGFSVVCQVLPFGFESTADSFSLTSTDLGNLPGSMSVRSGFTSQSRPCTGLVDAFSQTTHCQNAANPEAAQYTVLDNTFASSSMTAGQTQTFQANYAVANTFAAYLTVKPSAVGAGVQVAGTGLSAIDPDYLKSTAATWGLETTDNSVPAAPQTFFGTQGSLPSLTNTITFSLKATIEVQYDYHLPSVAGDPQFAGFQGQQFQVHGAPESYFALISAPNYYVNARFDYLSTGKCDYNETACFTHPGTYMGLIYVGMKDANILVQAGPHDTGFAGVLINDKPMQVGDRFSIPQLSANSHVHMVSESKLNLVLDTITLSIVNSDLFVNFDLALTDKQLLTTGAALHTVSRGATPSQISHSLSKWYGSYNPLHGLIGQTWRNVKYADNKLYQGDITEYQLDKIVDHTFLYCVYEN